MQAGASGTYTTARIQGSYTSTTSSDSYSGGTGDFSGFTGSYDTSSTATPTPALRRPTATHSPPSAVRNTVNAWKEGNPTTNDEKLTDSRDGLSSICRRAGRGSIRLRDHSLRGPRDAHPQHAETYQRHQKLDPRLQAAYFHHRSTCQSWEIMQIREETERYVWPDVL